MIDALKVLWNILFNWDRITLGFRNGAMSIVGGLLGLFGVHIPELPVPPAPGGGGY